MADVVFIDSRVLNGEQLLATLPLDVQVVYLDAGQDGIMQMARALDGVLGLDAIHIISHGSVGTLYLGDTVLTGDILDHYATELSAIGAALSNHGDILLYGCDVAAGTKGQAFIQQLSSFTGADIAASIDATGSSLLGGDWILETNTGIVETPAIITNDNGYPLILGAPVIASSGVLDTSRGDGGIQMPGGALNVAALAVQADGKIVMATGTDFNVTRLNADGSRDASFGVSGTASAQTGLFVQHQSIVIQSDGKIIVAGAAYPNALMQFGMARFNADGSLDTVFGDNGVVTTPTGTYHSEAYSVFVQSDGKIVLAGRSGDHGNDNFGLVRYEADGAVDAGFGVDGQVMVDFGSSSLAGLGEKAFAVTAQADGRIVVTGMSGDKFAVARLNADGSPDQTFGINGKVLTSVGAWGFNETHNVLLQPDGKIVISGSTSAGVTIIRYTADGNLDTDFDADGRLDLPSFYPGGFAYEADHSMALQLDGKIVVLGRTQADGVSHVTVMRVNPDGTPDITFGDNGTFVVPVDEPTSWYSSAIPFFLTGNRGDYPGSLVLQPDGGMVVTGIRIMGAVDYGSGLKSVGTTVVAHILPGGIPDQSVEAGTSYSYAFGANAFVDPDGGALTYSASLADGSPLPGWLTFDGVHRLLSGVPGDANTGLLDVRVTATDPSGLSVSDTFKLTVGHAPQAIAVIPDQQLGCNDIPYSFSLPPNAFSDADGDTLTYFARLANGLPLPPGMSFDGNTGTFSGRTINLFQGIFDIEVTASDGGLSSSTVFEFKVGSFGTSGADVLVGYDGINDYMEGGDGDDLMQGLESNDVLIGGAGNDTLDGGLASDLLLGGQGNDIIFGGWGNDQIHGDSGDDRLNGDFGDDVLIAGDGNDTVVVTHDDGNDVLSGGAGFDVLDYSAVTGVIQINQLGGVTTGSAGNDVILDVFEQVVGSNFDDVLSGGHGGDVLDGNGGNDLFFGNNGDDLMRGGDGDDTFFFSTSDGNDRLEGGNGFDVLDYSSLNGVVQVNQLAGTTTGTANNDILLDVFEMVIGTAFGDVLSGGHGINSLKGGGGDDQIFANNGDDYVSGGDGNDTITFGPGNDTLDFRNGEDVDTITDFTPGAGTADTITLTFYSGIPRTFAGLQGNIAQIGADTHIVLNGGDEIILQNVLAGSLHQDDFIF